MACPGGDQGRVDSGVEPGGYRRMAEVVRAARERRGCLRGLRADWRAVRQMSPYSLSPSRPPRGAWNSRPSDAVPNSRRWLLRALADVGLTGDRG
jgi:hypothetical protein